MVWGNRGVRLALVALALCSEVLLAQQMPGQQGQDLRFDSSGNQQQAAPQFPVQSPTIVTPQITPGADRVFSHSPSSSTEQRQSASPREQLRPPPPLERNEFQEFVLKSTGRDLPVFGYNLFDEALSTFAPLDRVPVPSDYVIGPGDEIMVRAWGQIDVDVRTTVDRNGRIYIPKVGAINVAATRYQDLDARVRSSVARVFKNFDLVVTLGELRSIQIFVVGQVRRPGSFTVSSLSTLVNALFSSGGPTTKGSLRKVQLKRGSKVVTEFDFYELLVNGDKSKDAALLPGDVIFVPAIGPLAAVSGSVNSPAIFELKQGQKLEELLAMAGGLSTNASGQKVTLERIAGRKSRVVEELALDATGLSRPVMDGDLVNVFTLSPRLMNAVTLRGNVATPVRFEWKDGLHISDIIPDRSMLVVPDYWLQRDRAGRAKSWLLEEDDESLQDADPNATAGSGSDVGADGRPTNKSNANLRNNSNAGKVDSSGRRLDIAQVRKREREKDEADGQDRERRDTAKVRRGVKRPGAEVNWDYALVERLNPVDYSTILIPFNLGAAIVDKGSEHNLKLEPGDIVTIFSKEDIQGPQSKQSKFVRLEGEFQTAGVYQIEPGETLRQLLARIGGITTNAYMYGAEFTRDSTRIQQQERLDEALGRLEVEMQRSGVRRAQSVTAPEDAQGLQAEAKSQQALLAKLRTLRATGRIVLEVKPEAKSLKDFPDMLLEDGDRLLVPARPSTVSVFGSVYNQNSYIYRQGKQVSDYLAQAGGPTRDADKSSLYVLRADGSVISKQQGGWFGRGFNGERMNPGDSIIVPEDLEKLSWTKELKDWTQIFYQLALGVVGLKVLGQL
jgi:polysaccharide export outer membrane protein